MSMVLAKSITNNNKLNLSLSKENALGKLGYYTKFTIEKRDLNNHLTIVSMIRSLLKTYLRRL